MKFGITWWGNSWMNALHDADFTNRIPRGKSYANTGKVYDIEIKDNSITSKVQGRYSDYYNTNIEFKVFTDKEKKIILDTINNSDILLSSLLNHELPIELYEQLSKKGIQVFPNSVDDFSSDCNCPDYAYICKHIAALIHMMVHEVDKDPFQVFKLQGCDLIEMLEYENSDNIKDISELFYHKNIVCDDVGVADYSTIDDLLEHIFIFLKDNPMFYDSDFKSILLKIYKSMASYYKKNIENQEIYSDNHLQTTIMLGDDKDTATFDENSDDFDEWLENILIKRWDNPNQWNNLSIDIDDNYEISQITTDYDCLFNKNTKIETLYSLLREISNIPKNKFNKNIQILLEIYQFTGDLIKKHAIIPELFKSKEKYYIRWIPAIFDKNIEKIIIQLSNECPDNLITYDNSKLSKNDQIITAVSLMIKGYLKEYVKDGLTQQNRKRINDSIFQLFFVKAQKFNEFKERNYEKLINQWLSKFSLTSRKYELYLVIDENENSFNVDIKVQLEEGKEILPIKKAINDTLDDTVKLQLLSDSYVIDEVLFNLESTKRITECVEYNVEDFSQFFIDILPLFEMLGLNIILPKNLQKIFRPKLVLNIEANNNQRGYITFNDITKFDWKIAIGDKNYDIQEFKQLAEKSKGLVKLANEYVILDENETKTLIKDIDKLPEKLNKHELLKATLSGQLDNADVYIDEQLSQIIENIKNTENIELPETINAQLRPYQKTGYSWLVQNINTGFGSILADDMGLGKTLQVLTTIQHFKDKGLLEKEKILVVAPTSLLTNWQEEIKRFTPELSSFIFHGTKRKFPIEEYDIYLTSYGIIRRDIDTFNKKKWFLTVIDEAQNIKNPTTKQTQSIKKIKTRHRIALSGTPVENRLSEYWSIFDFINKGYLTSLKKFKQNYITPIEKERNNEVLKKFKMITEPFIMRRLKSDKNIIKDLPEKITNDIYCNLSTSQASLYQEVLDSAMKDVEENEGMKRKGLVLKLINSLKQICNHPSQFTKTKYAHIEESGKMELLFNTLKNILEADEKVLIFTQYVQMGNIMKELIEDKFNQEVLFLHGSLNRKQRDILVDKFQNNSQNKIFIVSLKAGGTGLNLTAASNVIHYDLWWNPAVENQATDRAYRIGQTDNVMVYRFITKGTFEERINKMIQDKEELASLTVGSGEKFITEMNSDELKELLSLRDD